MRRYRRAPHAFMHELFTEYGDFVRWPGFFDVYLINHPEYVRRVLTQHHGNYSKRTIDYRVLARLMGRGLITSDGSYWAGQRRLMQPLFSSRNVNRFDKAINTLAGEVMVSWESRAGDDPVWIDREMHRLAFRIGARTLFGGDFERHADEVATILDVVNLEPQETRALMTLFSWIPTPYNLKWKRARKRLDHIVHRMIEARVEAPTSDDNILDRLVEARDPDTGERMSSSQIRDEVVTLMLAGHETSATALTWILYLLGTHPEIEQNLHDVLAAQLGGAPATAGDLARVPYLKQVVQESMRLYPPVWAVARRSGEADTLGAYELPPNSYVGIIPYALHRNEAFWPDPERFDPDRFGSRESAGRDSYCYLPFAAGPRSCIGAGMAMLEVQLVLAQLVQRFKARPVPGHAVEATAKVTLKPAKGLPMTLQRR